MHITQLIILLLGSKCEPSAINSIRDQGKMIELYASQEQAVILTVMFALVDLHFIEVWTTGLCGGLCSASALIVPCGFVTTVTPSTLQAGI